MFWHATPCFEYEKEKYINNQIKFFREEKMKAKKVKEPKKKGKNKRLTREERIKALVDSEPNFDAMDLSMKKFIVNSGLFPGMAEDIIAKERTRPPKRLFKEPMISR
jgi:hypothetical protein